MLHLAVCVHLLLEMLCCTVLLITIFPSEGFSGGSQSSEAGYSQLPFPAGYQTHVRSGTEGRWETFCVITTTVVNMTF